MVQFGVILFRGVENNLAAAAVQLKGDPDEVLQSLLDLLAAFVRDIEEHEAAAAGAQELAAARTAATRFLVDFIHLRVGNDAAQAAFEAPGLVQQVAEAI